MAEAAGSGVAPVYANADGLAEATGVGGAMHDQRAFCLSAVAGIGANIVWQAISSAAVGPTSLCIA